MAPSLSPNLPRILLPILFVTRLASVDEREPYGKRMKKLRHNIVDDYTRERLVIEADTSLGGGRVGRRWRN